MSAKTKISEDFPWTLTRSLREIGMAHLAKVYAEHCPPADYVTEGGRNKWRENPLPSKLFACYYSKKDGESSIQVGPLATSQGWSVVYVGTEPMCYQATKQFVRAFPNLPHKDPLSEFVFDEFDAQMMVRLLTRKSSKPVETLQEVPLLP